MEPSQSCAGLSSTVAHRLLALALSTIARWFCHLTHAEPHSAADRGLALLALRPLAVSVRLLMQRGLLITYLVVPAITLLILVAHGARNRPPDAVKWLVLPLLLVVNYAYFAAPHLAWLLFTRLSASRQSPQWRPSASAMRRSASQPKASLSDWSGFGLLIRTGGLGWKSRREHTALVGASRQKCVLTTSCASSPGCATHMTLKVRIVSPRFGARQRMSSLSSGHTSVLRSVGICSRAIVAMTTRRRCRDPFAWTPRFSQGSNVTSGHLSMTPGARPNFRLEPSAARCTRGGG